MPRFQGIPVDNVPAAGGRFGGVPVERSMAQEAGRVLGRTARNVIEGGASVAGIIANPANTLINYGIEGVNRLAGTHVPKLGMVTDVTAETLDRAGLPKAENGMERVADEAAKALVSVPAFGAGAAATGARMLAPLTERLGMQAASAVGSGAGVGTAREIAPDNIPLQIAAGVVGGMLPGARMPVDPARAARLSNFERAGVRPSVPDVTQSTTSQRAQKFVEAVPFAGSTVRAREAERLAQASGAADDVARGYGTARTPQAIGDSAQTAIQNYRFGARPEGMTDREILLAPTRNSSVSAKANVLYNRIGVEDDAVVPVTRTQQALASGVNRFDNPELSADMATPRIARWQQILDRANGLSWRDLRQMRTEVRYLRGRVGLDPTLDDRMLSQLDDALTQDIHQGARLHGGDTALGRVQRADAFYARSMARINDHLKSVYNANTPEKAFVQIENALSANPTKSDIGKLNTLRRVMSPDEWGDFSATVIDRMGRPTPGTRGASDAPEFSVGQFVTRYGAMSRDARRMLFDGAGRGELRNRLDALYNAARDMKSTDQLANRSQSGNQMIAGGTYGLGVVDPISTGIGVLGANLTARALYNPAFVRLATMRLRANNPQARATVATQITRFAAQNPLLASDANSLLRGLTHVRAEDTEETK